VNDAQRFRARAMFANRAIDGRPHPHDRMITVFKGENCGDNGDTGPGRALVPAMPERAELVRARQESCYLCADSATALCRCP
jgi:hypothetical protein